MSFKNPLQGALYAFDKGFKVFPLKPYDSQTPDDLTEKELNDWKNKQKAPAFTGWQDWAKTANRKKIEQHGRANPLSNWGVYCGISDLLVIDLDIKKGVSGGKTLKKLIAENKPLPKTMTVTTPSGGTHIYYKGKHKTSSKKLGEGIDTRGVGGYVVAPGSRIGDREYEISNVVDDIPELPRWLASKLSHETSQQSTTQNNSKSETAQSPKTNHTLITDGERNATLASIAGVLRRRGMGKDVIYDSLKSISLNQIEGTMSDKELHIIANSITKYEPEEAEIASDFLVIPDIKAHTAADIKPKEIEKRDWVMQHRYIGKYVSIIVSPGGVGKSTLTLLDALSVAANKPLTGFPIIKPGKVWLYNTEDPTDEIERRIIAAMLHHNIPTKALENIFYSSGIDAPLILAKSTRDGVVVNKSAIDSTVKYINDNKIVMLIVDPFVKSHEVDENNNMHIDKVVWCFQRISNRTGCAICLVHHTRKPGANQKGAGDSNTARGASALINAARVAHTINSMDEKEAKEFHIEKERCKWFFRLDNAKANLQPPAERADWFERHSVTLPNTDDVGTVERADIADLAEAKRSEEYTGERADLAKYLFKLLPVNSTISIKELYNIVSADAEEEHIFKKYNSERKGRDYLIRMTREPILFKNREYSYKFDNKKRPCHFVTCTALESYLQ